MVKCLFLFLKKNEYSQKHPRGINPVQLNDVFFAIHAVMLTLITIVQVLTYRVTKYSNEF